jgi:hypothetical protein
MGHVRLSDLEDTHGMIKFKVIPDPRFVADKPVSAYAEIAYTRGLIVT